MTTIHTERLTLRPFAEADVVPMMEIHQDPEVIKHVLFGASPGGVGLRLAHVAVVVAFAASAVNFAQRIR